MGEIAWHVYNPHKNLVRLGEIGAGSFSISISNKSRNPGQCRQLSNRKSGKHFELSTLTRIEANLDFQPFQHLNQGKLRFWLSRSRPSSARGKKLDKIKICPSFSSISTEKIESQKSYFSKSLDRAPNPRIVFVRIVQRVESGQLGLRLPSPYGQITELEKFGEL